MVSGVQAAAGFGRVGQITSSLGFSPEQVPALNDNLAEQSSNPSEGFWRAPPGCGPRRPYFGPGRDATNVR